MRVPLLSACCAALALAALPAAAHGWSSGDGAAVGPVERNCPVLQASPVPHHSGGPAIGHRHGRPGGGCPVAAAEPGHYAYQRVFTRNEHDWSQADQGSWRRDRRAWADGAWSGRVAERAGLAGPGCQDANGPEAYRDRDGGPRAAPDRGMRCHDAGMHREVAYAQSRGAFGYERETGSGWSSSSSSFSSERHGGWSDARRWSSDRPSMTDRYGYLTWPGKTHFIHGQPIGPMGVVAPDIGPQAPPEESWQVHP